MYAPTATLQGSIANAAEQRPSYHVAQLVPAFGPSVYLTNALQVPLWQLSRYRVAPTRPEDLGSQRPLPRYTPRRQHQLPRGKASKHRCSQIQGTTSGYHVARQAVTNPFGATTWQCHHRKGTLRDAFGHTTTWQHVATRSLQFLHQATGWQGNSHRLGPPCGISRVPCSRRATDAHALTTTWQYTATIPRTSPPHQAAKQSEHHTAVDYHVVSPSDYHVAGQQPP